MEGGAKVEEGSSLVRSSDGLWTAVRVFTDGKYCRDGDSETSTCLEAGQVMNVFRLPLNVLADVFLGTTIHSTTLIS